MITARTSSADDTRKLAEQLASVVRAGDILLLSGDLGAGKTTWTQGFGRGLGVTDQITSPTFTLLRNHPGRELELLHADVYRLDMLQEVVDLGLTELVDDAAVAVVEWGDLAAPALPADYLAVTIELGDEDDDRTFTLLPVGRSWTQRTDEITAAVAPWAVVGDDA